MWALVARRFFVRRTHAVSASSVQRREEKLMWWWIGGGILYLVLLFTLGFMTIRNGHGWLFFFGIFFPLLWVFGAFMRRSSGEYA
jgi:hypothetical protein